MKTLRLAWRQLRRDLASGDVRILLAALVLAVMAVSSVGFVTDRAERALALEANRLLGGDAVLRADGPITGALRDAASAPGLKQTETLNFPSMIRAGESLRLGELKALGEGFPLRGRYRIDELRERRALVVDDKPVTCLVLSQMLREIGMRSESVASGNAALESVADADQTG